MKKLKPHAVDWAQIDRFLASADKKLTSAHRILAFDEEACGSAFEKTKRRANSRVADLVLPPAIKRQLKDRAKEVSLKNLRPETAAIQ